MPRQLSLLDLNNDCLASILRFLPAEDHLHFAHTCTRLRNVFTDCGRSLYRSVKLTGSREELLLMRVVGHLVKDLCLPSNWNVHVDWLSKTINCLAKLENVTLNFDHFPTIHSTEAIFWTLEKLPNLRGIRVVQNSAFHNVYNRAHAQMWIPNSYTNSEKLLGTIQKSNPTIPTHDWVVINPKPVKGPSKQVILFLTNESATQIDRARGILSLGLNFVHPWIYARGAVSGGNRDIQM